MISLLEAISPTAQALLAGEAQYQFAVRTRYYCGTYLASCHGAKASSTNSPAVAAENAAFKHFKKVCATLSLDGSRYACTIKETVADDLFTATFTRRNQP
jgi:hypothetical protein